MFSWMILLFTILVSTKNLHAQGPLPPTCGMDSILQFLVEEESFDLEGKSHGCSHSHSFNNIYTDLNRYIPEGGAIKVRANFIIVQRQDGSGNFQDIPEHRAFLDDWFAECQNALSNTWWSGQSQCLPPASTTEIQIIPNWIFMPDPSSNHTYWNFLNGSPNGCPNTPGWWLNPLDAAVQADPNIPKGINVYFTIDADIYDQLVVLQTISNPEDAGMGYTWCSEQPSMTNLTKPSRISIANLYLKYYWFKNHIVLGEDFSVTRQWLVGEGKVLAHEFGHSFIGEYVHYNDCSDHLMSQNVGRSMRTLDVQFMHRGIMYNSLRQYIDCDTRYNASMYSDDREWVIQSNEEWVLDTRIYHNIKVKAGATLTIKCKVLLPQDGVVIVERGGRLIIDGGKVWRANTCGITQHWAGIAVNGNPNILQPSDPYATLGSNDAGVVILKGNGEIEGAIIGVGTKSHPHWDVPSDRGGRIVSEDFTIRNCQRGIEFNRYDFPNFSYFKNTIFESDGGEMAWGVTNWRTNNVLFEGCTFRNIFQDGIVSYDATYTVSKNNVFDKCILNAIKAGGSLKVPGNIIVGLDTNIGSDRNEINKSIVGFRGTGYTNAFIFNNNMENFDFDIAVTGLSSTIMTNNYFKAGAAGIQFESTGYSLVDAKCNLYYNNMVGINIVGQNNYFNFNNENFYVQRHDVFIEGLWSNPGFIPNQGGTGIPRYNYFTNGLTEQIKTSTVFPWNNTNSFYYFHPLSSNLQLIPKCALNDGTCGVQSNFYNIPTFGQESNCESIFEFMDYSGDCQSMECLEEIRQAIAEIENSEGLSESEEMQALLISLISEREKVANFLYSEFFVEKDWESITILLESDLNSFNLQRLVSLSLWKDDFTAADNYLSMYPENTVEDQQFKLIQTINRAFLSDPEFTLSEENIATLTETAISGTAQAGVAQSLLHLLTDLIFMPRLPILGSEYESQPWPNQLDLVESIRTAEFQLYPVPANNILNIKWNPLGETSNLVSTATFEIFDIFSGSLMTTGKIDQSVEMQIEVSTWPSGMYIAKLVDNISGSIISSKAVLISH